MKKQASIPGIAEHDLESQALSLQQKAKYKDAIKLYKKILQVSDNVSCKQNLAYCYIQRAKDFAVKGMYKEALVLWENHRVYAHSPYAAYDQYIIWLIQTNNLTKIEASLGELTAQQLDTQYPALANVLGLLMLSGHPEFAHSLPQDSLLIAHFNLVQTALQAYQDNNTEKLNEALRQLPYRSAFRDFRTLFNAILVMPDSPAQAQIVLAKIRVSSPYAQAAKILLACTREGAELAGKLVQLNYQQRSFVSEIKGLSKNQLDFIEHFCRQHKSLSDKVQFNLAIQYQSLIGAELAQHFCQTLLASYPAGNKEFNKHFSEASELEENRVKALFCEQDNNLYDAEYYWKQCIDILDNEAADNSLKIALILQRMAATEPEGEKRTGLLIDSVAYDPDNRNTYLQIIHYFSQQQKTLKEHKQWLVKTLEKFPQDVEVLTQAVKAATRNKTHKKASQYASKILKIDPLNTFAKQTLFSSYLAHARRLMREKNYHLVEKEISKAEQLNIGKAYLKQVQLMRALLCFANINKQQGLQDISSALDNLYADPVNIQFQATVSALLNGLPVATLLRELPDTKEHILSAQELTVLIQQLNQYANDHEDRDYLSKALDKIKPPLKKSLTEHEYDEKLLLNLCQALDTVEHFELLRHCAKLAQRKWATPIWMYYRVYADNNGDATECSDLDVYRLQYANHQAAEDKDFPTAILIDKFLDSYFDAHPQQAAGFLEGLFGDFMDGDAKEFDDPLAELFDHLSDRVMIDLNARAESLLKTMTPEKLTQELAQQVGEEQSLFLAMMVNPEIFSALILLKAADELHIDIDANIYDVIEVFGISDKKNSFPLPF
ncbi:hypothetical protein AU255_09645 [Methyloprofundus sedimenti]|uniref:Tetratricopeptide repeat protein n=1 Tax=Methyloprofundus sedimenti TaxID=1420851 RepID=A0A1V8M987_9GAMM|nr:hypothetical protein [Methyloprofundus sedimenti]OQK18088.1 hypothetical protein AU255_09645 [Methyloprofundus sedimenti]